MSAHSIIFANKKKITDGPSCVEQYRLIGQVGRVFTNGPEDLCSIPGRVIPKTLKMVLDTIYQPLRSGRIWHKVNL